MRLTTRGTSVAKIDIAGFAGPVTLTAWHHESNDVVQIYPDVVPNPTDTTFGPGEHLWDYGYLPPGHWTVAATDGTNTRTQEIYIDPAPVVTLLDPDWPAARTTRRRPSAIRGTWRTPRT